MKKLFLCFVMILLGFVNLQNFSLAKDNKKTDIQVSQALWHMSNNCKYDLNTFKYDSIKKEFSIDIYYDYDYMYSAQLISPFDKRPISKLIFATKFYPNENKMDITYKGHTSSDFVIEENDSVWYRNEKIYYDKNTNPRYIPNLQQYIDDFVEVISSPNGNDYYLYKKAIVEEVYDKYKRIGLEKLKEREMPSHIYTIMHRNPPSKVAYDLKTYKYIPSTEEFIVDVFYEFDYNAVQNIPAPYDEYKGTGEMSIERNITFLIFGTKYNPKTKKLYVSYKGFEQGNFVEEDDGGYYDNVDEYYDNNPKYLPKLSEYIDECKKSLKEKDEEDFSLYRKEVAEKLFDLYKRGELLRRYDLPPIVAY